MGRRKTDLYKSDEDIFNEEWEEKERKKNSIIKKLNGKTFERDRRIFLENAIKLNDIFEYRRKNKLGDAERVTRAKNILQSLVYLILNDEFYDEIMKIRTKISVPFKGFDSERGYNNWALEYGKRSFFKSKILSVGEEKEFNFISYGYEKVYRVAEVFIKKHNLCYAKDVMRLAPILSRFISRKLNFEIFFILFYPLVYEHALNCRKSSEACDKFKRGFEIKVVELEDSELTFFTSRWSYKIFPFTKLTGIGYTGLANLDNHIR